MFNHSSIVFVLFSSSAHFDTGRLDSTPWLAPLKLDCYKQEKHLRPNKNLVLIRSHCCEAVVYIYVLCWNTSTAAFSAFKEVGCRLGENSYLCFWSLYLEPLGGTVQVISETTFHITVIIFFSLFSSSQWLIVYVPATAKSPVLIRFYIFLIYKLSCCVLTISGHKCFQNLQISWFHKGIRLDNPPPSSASNYF